MTQESVIWSERHVLLTDADAAVMGPHTEWTAWIGDARLSILESETGDLICATVAPPAGSEHEWSLTPADGTHDLRKTKAIAERVARALQGNQGTYADPKKLRPLTLDVENTLDPSWAERLGIDPSRIPYRDQAPEPPRDRRPPPIGIEATAGHGPDCVCSQCETGSDGCRGDTRLWGLVHRSEAVEGPQVEKRR